MAIGGGKTLDAAKYAATLAALPMVAVATNLAHDGLCSPVATLEYPHGRGSFGVSMPLAVVVDLDYVSAAPPRMVSAGIGDAVSNLSAIDDWYLAHRERGEPVDGLAVTFARTAAEAMLHRSDGIEDDDFLIALAESLVLSGMAMSVAGTSRPCSGACHEIIYAVNALWPDVSNHGELAGLGALFAYALREDERTVLADRAMPAPPRAAEPASRHRPVRRAVRPSRHDGAVHASGPLHDLGAPRPRRAGDPRAREGLRLIARLRPALSVEVPIRSRADRAQRARGGVNAGRR